MAVTIGQLIAEESLCTRLAAGAGGLDRTVTWAHACDLPDPWHWVDDGVLLLTTGPNLPGAADEQVRYLRELDRVGAVGIAVGEGMGAPALTDELLEVSDALGFPVLHTQRQVPWIAVARVIAAAAQEVERARIEKTARVYEILRSGAAADLTLERLLPRLEGVSGYALEVRDTSTGRSLNPASNRAPVDGVRMLIPGPRAIELVAASEGDDAPNPTLLRHVASACAVILGWSAAEQERSRRLGASLLAALLDERIDPRSADEQLAERGLGRRPMLTIALSAPSDEVLQQVQYAMHDAGAGHLMLTRGEVTTLLVADDPAPLEALLGALPACSAAGASDPFTDLGGIPRASREAVWAMHRARARRRPLVHHGEDQGESAFLPADPRLGAVIAHTVLERLIDYDEEHSSAFVETLSAFLEENRSWVRTARRLDIHRQTLTYRIGRIESLTGRSLSNTGDVADLWLALQALAAGRARVTR